jgi:hypothetical protein
MANESFPPSIGLEFKEANSAFFAAIILRPETFTAVGEEGTMHKS